jgi:hypothetical protein
VIGIVTLIRPQFSYRVDQHREQIAGSSVLFETRKVIHFPLWFSIPVLVIGAAMVIIGSRQD